MRLCNICGHFVNTSIKKPDMIIFHTQLKATFMKKRKIRYYEKVKGKKKVFSEVQQTSGSSV